jgi:hypothetical protein
VAPFADGFIGHLNAAIEQYLLNLSIAEREGVIEPDAVANDFGRKAVARVPGRSKPSRRHSAFYRFSQVKVTVPLMYYSGL